ncbi:SusC/RagA family TonB-linked outer membrane protein [Pseudobacter ginsenosidimutans]|nr:SusC/RagA family TonB-linked outer membrane protein [Pseudobacter ginsenosidimutans]
MMKLTMFFMLAAALTVSATTKSQTVSLSGKNLPLLSVFNTVEKQTGYVLFANQSVFENSRTVTLDVKNMPLDAFLKQVLKDQPIDFFIKDKTIVLKKKQVTAAPETINFPAPARDPITGKLTDSTGAPLAGATVSIRGKETKVMTDNNGQFTINAEDGDVLQITYVGYENLTYRLKAGTRSVSLMMAPKVTDETEVVVTAFSTGYQNVPKERATGSFEQIDNRLLNRTTGANILSRLEGIANGVQFLTPGSNDPANVRVRGLSTIEANSRPLIVIDNFPYEGNYTDYSRLSSSNQVDLSFINPNDIESITILKDAAAASIWGARAANGVIVINTKKGKFNQKAKVSFSQTTTIGDIPDLMYDRNRLPAETMMEIEKFRYKNSSAYDTASSDRRVIPEYAYLMRLLETGQIDPATFEKEEQRLKNTEVRNDIEKYLMQRSVLQQYALNVRGGGQNYNYFLSAGYDRNRNTNIGDRDDRFNISMNNSFMPVKNLTMQAGIAYTNTKRYNNGITTGDLSGANNIGLSPYMRLVDENGNPASIVKDLSQHYKDWQMAGGMMDWNYRPLEERNQRKITANGQELRINASVNYRFLNRFDLSVQYQKTTGSNNSSSHYYKESYYVRNLVNKFTTLGGVQQIPYGDIFIEGTPYKTNSNTFRGQLNYNEKFGSDHAISALVGTEVREMVRESSPGYYLYGYDPMTLSGKLSELDVTVQKPVRPGGNQFIPSQFPLSNTLTKYTDRFLSYYTNASYTYKGRYTISGSARYDGSNLFGVKTNQKWQPLWSVGGKWDIDRENFYHSDWVPGLTLRATYGIAGNVTNLLSRYPAGTLQTDANSRLPFIKLGTVGNPSLRWEQINTLNLAVDFTLKNNRISGSIEYYAKKSSDLIGDDYLPPSSGVISQTWGTAQNSKKVNYANMKTHGFDFRINTKNLTGPLSWNSTILLSTVKNEVTNVFVNPGRRTQEYFGGSAAVPPVTGVSRDMIYAVPWLGLDHETGLPIMYLNGEKSTNYTAYINNMKKEDLVNAGVAVPTMFGSLRNDLSYKNFSLSFLITWKTGHVFRRNSISSGAEYSGVYHMDYFKRWQKPGDELHTYVPAYSATAIAALPTFYNFSEVLITKGDVVRLQDISLSYALTKFNIPRLPVERVNIIANVRNVGMLWKANDFGIDPDFANAAYVTPRTFALGIQLDF